MTRHAILLVCSCITATALPVDLAGHWDLIDITQADGRRIRDYMNAMPACVKRVQLAFDNALAASGVRSRSFDLTSLHLPTLAQANGMYNLTRAALRVGKVNRDALQNCVANAQCDWLPKHIDAACAADEAHPPAAHFPTDIFTRDKLATWLVRGISATLLLDSPRRQLSTLDGVVESDEDDEGMFMWLETFFEAMLDFLASFGSGELVDPAEFLADFELSDVFEAFGRRLSWSSDSHMLNARSVNVNYREFLESIPSITSEQVRDAEAAIGRIQEDVTKFAVQVYMDLPPTQKMYALSMRRNDNAYKLLSFLKGTQLKRTIARMAALQPEEVSTLQAFASGEVQNSDATIKVVLQRFPQLSDAEKSALSHVMRATAPLLRGVSVALMWLAA